MTHEVIIPGRTLVPPQGLITLELRNATNGRLRKKVQVENAIMDWWLNAAPYNKGVGYRDKITTSTSSNPGMYDSLNPLANAVEYSIVPPRSVNPLADYKQPGFFPSGTPQPQWVWASGSDAAVDTGKTNIPTVDPLGDLTAAAKLQAAFVADGIQNRRGTLDPGACFRNWDQQRVVVKFSTAQGNGIYRSIGVGSCTSQTIAPGGLRPAWQPVGTVGASIPNGTLDNHYAFVRAYWPEIANQAKRCWLSEASDVLWIQNANNSDLYRVDLNDTDQTQPVNWVDYNTQFPGASNLSWAVYETAADFWMLKAGILYRCAINPAQNTPIVALNTYDLSGTLSGATMNLTFDGTNLWIIDDTHVRAVNPVTGAFTGANFAHGIVTADANALASIQWDPAEQLLWVNRQPQTSGSDSGWGYAATGQFSWRIEPDNCVVRGFTTAGVQQKAFMGVHRTAYTDEQLASGQINAMTSDGQKMMTCFGADGSPVPGTMVPSMITHAVLGADLEKTSDDTLAITYDFNYT